MSVPVGDVVWLGTRTVEDARGRLPAGLQAAAERIDAIVATYRAGEVDVEAACQALAECVVEGPDGRSWTRGATSGRWYVEVRGRWEVADPPRA